MKSIPVFLLGFGGVGRALLRQLVAARNLHAQRLGLRLEVVGIADSKTVLINPQGLPGDALAQLHDAKTRLGTLHAEDASPFTMPPTPRAWRELPGGLAALANPAGDADRLPPGTIIVDTTASDAGVPLMLRCRYNGWRAVLANKLPLAGPIEWWDEIATPFNRWETTCGSAMPVISTLNTLLNAGDRVTKIEGSLSGTLAYLAAELEKGTRFGDAVREAKRLGYTEPDPRQDLGGRDAGRKALILARMLGARIGLEDVSIESLYPASMDALSVDAFLREVDALNEPMARRAAELSANGRKLRYAALIENGRCALSLTGADPESKLGKIHASDGIVVFTTAHFSGNPLAVSGRGAGQEVTAMGVMGDIISMVV